MSTTSFGPLPAPKSSFKREYGAMVSHRKKVYRTVGKASVNGDVIRDEMVAI